MTSFFVCRFLSLCTFVCGSVLFFGTLSLFLFFVCDVLQLFWPYFKLLGPASLSLAPLLVTEFWSWGLSSVCASVPVIQVVCLSFLRFLYCAVGFFGPSRLITVPYRFLFPASYFQLLVLHYFVLSVFLS